jgi:hypothetical protein
MIEELLMNDVLGNGIDVVIVDEKTRFLLEFNGRSVNRGFLYCVAPSIVVMNGQASQGHNNAKPTSNLQTTVNALPNKE